SRPYGGELADPEHQPCMAAAGHARAAAAWDAAACDAAPWNAAAWDAAAPRRSPLSRSRPVPQQLCLRPRLPRARLRLPLLRGAVLPCRPVQPRHGLVLVRGTGGILPLCPAMHRALAADHRVLMRVR